MDVKTPNGHENPFSWPFRVWTRFKSTNGFPGPLRGRIECILINAIRTAFPRVVRGNLKACCSDRGLASNTEQVLEVQGALLVLWQELVDHFVRSGDFFVDERPPQRDNVLPLGVLVGEQDLQGLQVGALVALQINSQEYPSESRSAPRSRRSQHPSFEDIS